LSYNQNIIYYRYTLKWDWYSPCAFSSN